MIDSLWHLLNDQLTELDCPIIWSYQNAPRVGKPYIMLDYTTVDVPDHDVYSSQIDEDGYRINSSSRSAAVTVQFFCGRESYGLASKASLLLATEDSFNKMHELDCAVGTRLNLSRIPALLNESQFEERAIYAFNFNYTEHYKEFVGIIEEVELEGKYSGGKADPDGSKGTVFCKETIRIPYRPKQ